MTAEGIGIKLCRCTICLFVGSQPFQEKSQQMFEFLKQFRRNRPMRIVVNGHPALRERSAPVGEITEDVRQFAAELTRSLRESEVAGVGLAAPQVGVNLRMIVIDTAPRGGGAPRPEISAGELLLEPRMPLVMLNPEIISAGAECDTVSEGCLSLPGVNGHVTRPTRVTLHTRLLDGEEITVECGGLLARCLQHEIDHLDGRLFYDRLSPAEQKAAAETMKTLAKREASLARTAAGKRR